jgi:hypothetical protein
MTPLKLVLTTIFILSAISSFSQVNSKSDCSSFRNGKFKYLDAADTSAYIVMAGDKQVEYSMQDKYIIESDVKWISDCTYMMTMTRITIPSFPFKPGDKMKVDITKIEGDIIYYTSTVKGESWQGRFKRL